jgi:hypothetical protein
MWVVHSPVSSIGWTKRVAFSLVTKAWLAGTLLSQKRSFESRAANLTANRDASDVSVRWATTVEAIGSMPQVCAVLEARSKGRHQLRRQSLEPVGPPRDAITKRPDDPLTKLKVPFEW